MVLGSVTRFVVRFDSGGPLAVERRRRRATVEVEGDLRSDSLGGLAALLQEVSHEQDVVIDLRSCQVVTASAFGVLVEAAKGVVAHGGTFRVLADREPVQRVFAGHGMGRADGGAPTHERRLHGQSAVA